MSRHAVLLALAGAAACHRPLPPPAVPKARVRARVETVTVNVPAAEAARRARWTAAQRDSALAVLARQRVRWAAARPRRYRYWEHRWCFCGMAWTGPRVITVVDGRVVSATDTVGRRGDSAYVRRAAQRPLGGIDALFADIAAGIRDTAYARVRVAFDPARGHPTSVTFDRDWLASDDEHHVDVSRVEPLP